MGRDVPALMPGVVRREAVKVPGMGAGWVGPDDPRHKPGLAFNPGAQGIRVRQELALAVDDGRKGTGRRTAPGLGARFTSRDCGVEAAEARKGAGAGAEWFDQNLCQLSSKSSARKAASARIAKIPFALSSHIARVYLPRAERVA